MIRRLPPRARALIFVFALVAAGCGGGEEADAGTGTPSENPPDPFSLVASSDLAVGENRFLLALRDANGSPLGSPSEPMTMRVFPEGGSDSAELVTGSFVWIVPDVTGLYRTDLTFNQPGIWIVEADLAGTVVPASSFIVQEVPATPAAGEPAPASITPTGADFPLADITTDPNPEPAFYELSVDEALSSGKPSVIVFSTPAFCVTQACGPMLELMKGIAGDWPAVNWIHVEVFENIQDPDNRRYVSAVTEWNLPTEPWVFIADADGFVAASFEGVVDTDEVTEVLTALA